MNMNCKKWLEDKIAEIVSLESYIPEKTIKNATKQSGLSSSDIIKLNFNENLYIKRTKLVALLKEVAEECDPRLYPQEEEDKLRPCDSAYDKRVAGVISGAGDYRPGIVLDRQPSSNKRTAIAISGKVYCKVDAQHGAIEVGDLLIEFTDFLDLVE